MLGAELTWNAELERQAADSCFPERHIEKSLSWFRRSWHGALELSTNSSPGLLALGHSGLLALLLTWMGAFMGPGDAGPTSNLDLTRVGAHFWRQGPHTGTRASLGSRVRDTMIQCNTARGFLNCYTEAENSTPHLKERAAMGGWRL